MFDFLWDAKKDTVWAKYQTLTAVMNLVAVTIETNTLFLQSKITLRTSIFSLHAGNFSERIHRVSPFLYLSDDQPSASR